MVEELKIEPVNINDHVDPTTFTFEYNQLEAHQYLLKLGYDIYRSEAFSRVVYRSISIEDQQKVLKKIERFDVDIRKQVTDTPLNFWDNNESPTDEQWTVLDVLLTGFTPDTKLIALIRKQKAGYLLSVKRPIIRRIIDTERFNTSDWLREINQEG